MSKRQILLCCACFALAAVLLSAGVRQAVPAAFSMETASASGAPVLILDAGHGGEDGGAVSAAGGKESEVNLAIVLKMEALMVFLGVEPVLIRREDISLHTPECATLREKKRSDLQQRAALIQRTENAMVISVHQNYFTDSRYSGAQVFYNPGDVSRQWGERTQQALRQVLDGNNERKAAGLSSQVYLFEHISCPAILVECGFLSNGEEASLLFTQGYQKKIAVALSGAYIQELQRLSEAKVI